MFLCVVHVHITHIVFVTFCTEVVIWQAKTVVPHPSFTEPFPVTNSDLISSMWFHYANTNNILHGSTMWLITSFCQLHCPKKSKVLNHVSYLRHCRSCWKTIASFVNSQIQSNNYKHNTMVNCVVYLLYVSCAQNRITLHISSVIFSSLQLQKSVFLSMWKRYNYIGVWTLLENTVFIRIESPSRILCPAPISC